MEGIDAWSPTSVHPHGLAIDAAGDAYVVGQATSGFPTTGGALQTTCSSNCGFVAKLNPSGSALSFSTYLDAAFPNVVTVDSSQNIYIAGSASSNGFSAVNSLQSCGTAGTNTSNGFVSEISAAGALTFSTCLGQLTSGSAQVFPASIADVVLDGAGNLYAIGSGASTLPLQNPIQLNPSTLFLAAINPNAPSLLFSSWIGAGSLSVADDPSSVAVDSSGNIFAAGFSGTLAQTIPTFPIYNALQPAPALANPSFPCLRCEMTDGFVLKISPTNAAAAAVVPGFVDFSLYQPVVPVGTASTPQTVTIIDMGSAALTVSNVSVTGDFSIQQSCSTVAPTGGTCAIQVTFTPTAAGARTGALTITDSSAGSPHTVQLLGQGGQASVALSPTSLAFPSQALNTTSAAQTVTLTDTGALNLQVSQVQVTGPFAETNTCGTLVPVNISCKISVTFTPTAAGAATGSLIFTDSAADSPQTVALSGNSGTPSLGLGIGSGGSASATVSAGSTATYNLSIGGTGVGGTASLSCSGAPTGAVCTVPATVALNGSTASTFKVSVATAAHSQLMFYPFGSTPWWWVLAILGCLALFIAASALPSSRLRWRVVPLFALALCACGGGSSPSSNSGGTPSGLYTLTITATSGSVSQTQNLTLTVQ
jgi:hypothetical protein